MGISWEGESADKREAIGEKEPKECVFCGIIEGKNPSIPITSTERAVSFMSLEGHPLVIPKTHLTNSDLDTEEGIEEFGYAQRLASKLVPIVQNEYSGATGVNVMSNHGKSAGQEIEHLHIHVLPRFDGDGRLKLGKLPEVPMDVRQKIANSIKAKLSSSF